MAGPPGRGSGPGGPRAPEIELARLDDAIRLASMSRRWVEHGLSWRWRSDAMAREIRQPECSVPLVRDGREVAGFAVMRFFFDTRRAHLLLLAVDPQHRRQGIATALCEWLVVVARRGGVERLSLEVRERSSAARRLYEKLGFRVAERLSGYYEGREDALRMERALNVGLAAGRSEGRRGHPGMAWDGHGFDPFQL